MHLNCKHGLGHCVAATRDAAAAASLEHGVPHGVQTTSGQRTSIMSNSKKHFYQPKSPKAGRCCCRKQQCDAEHLQLLPALPVLASLTFGMVSLGVPSFELTIVMELELRVLQA
jgi:hypothetical protein